MTEDTLAVFVDTNILLHFQRIDHIDWPSLVEARLVEVVVTAVVLAELNKKQFEAPSEKIRKRAESQIRFLRDSKSQSPTLRPNTTVKFDLVNPKIDYSAYGLDPRVADDHLLARTIEHRDANPATKVILFTNDIALEMKAEAHGIQVLVPPDHLKLPSELDPKDKEVNELRRKAAAFEASLPKLRLVWANGQTLLELPTPENPTPVDKISRLEKLRRDHPLMLKQSQLNPSDRNDLIHLFAAMSSFTAISDAEVEKYNQALTAFYQQYEGYLNELEAFTELESRTVTLDLVLSNTGSAPALDIDITLNVPSGFELQAIADYPTPPREPNPPVKPRPRILQIAELAGDPFKGTHPDWLSNPHYQSERRPPNVSRPHIRPTNSYEVQIKVQRLKQHNEQPLEPMYAVFPTLEAITSFGISYRINSENHPDLQEGQLHISRKA